MISAQLAKQLKPMEQVLAVHPNARCTGGREGPESWVIHEFCPGGLGEPPILGRGKSGAAAWSNAAKLLTAKPEKTTQATAAIDY